MASTRDICDTCGHDRFFHTKGGLLAGCVAGLSQDAAHTFAGTTTIALVDSLYDNTRAFPLVGYWKLDNNLNDAFVHSITATMGNGSATYGDGKVAPVTNGAAVSASARNYSVNDPKLDNATFSFSFWSFHNSTDAKPYQIMNKDFGTSGWRLFTTSSGILEWDGTGEVGNVQTLASVSVDAWIHLIGTYDDDANIQRLYANGVLQNTATSVTIDNTSTAATLFGDTGAGAWTGRLDNFALYDGVLSQTDITRLYNGGSGVVILT